MSWDNWGDYGDYVSAAERRRRAAATAQKLEKKGQKLAPVRVEGRSITNTFWGKAWCQNLESYSDYGSRLPRGRSYVRNGSVLDLQIQRGVITAMVAGTSVYNIKIKITALEKAAWTKLKRECAGKVGSLIDLLRGKLSGPVMEIITRKADGLFPKPKEIDMDCSCPDWADMCKHVAATLYGVGVRLDESPELLFTLRGVDHLELIAETTQNLSESLTASADSGTDTLDEGSLSEVFGIDLEPAPMAVAGLPVGKAPKPKVPPTAKKIVAKPSASGRKQSSAGKLSRGVDKKIKPAARTMMDRASNPSIKKAKAKSRSKKS